MKLKNLFYLLLALPLAFASCDALGGDEPAPTPSNEVKLTVTSALAAEFDAEGGPGIITYTFENAPEGASISVTSTEDWVNEFNVASMITYNVDANDSEEAREAKIVISYEEQVFEVTVQQAGKEVVKVPALTLVSESVVEFASNGGASSVEFTLENPVEGVELDVKSSAEWLHISQVVENAVDYLVDANEGEAREATITITYGMLDPIVVTVKQAEYIDPSEVVEEFDVVECWASCENGGYQWDVTFVEHDETKGDMQTKISFALAEANSQRITDGTYTVENGGILLNPANENGFSTYRGNASDAADIYAASFVVATDTVNKTISIVGTFSAADVNIAINYNGEMRGMDLSEAVAGAIEHTEWTSVTKNYNDARELLFTAKSADGSLTAVFDFYDYDSSKVLAAGTYEVSDPINGVAHLRSSSYFTYNGVESQLASGSAVVEHIAGGYKITYNIVDKLGREFAGVIEGEILDASNPA